MIKEDNQVIDREGVTKIYLEKAKEWLLFKIIESDQENNPTKFRLIYHNPNKEDLLDSLEDDKEWNWQKRYLILFADPTKPCAI